jgi:hypothetical protein
MELPTQYGLAREKNDAAEPMMELPMLLRKTGAKQLSSIHLVLSRLRYLSDVIDSEY